MITSFTGIQRRARISAAEYGVSQLVNKYHILRFETGVVVWGCPDDFQFHDPQGPITHPQSGLVTKPSVGSAGFAPAPECSWSQGAVDAWKGPYFPDSKDPWGNSYWIDNDFFFCIGGLSKPFKVAQSLGPDGIQTYPSTTGILNTACTTQPTDDIWKKLD